MRILVLGGTRFLGRRLVLALHAGGHEVTVLSRRDGRLPEAIRCVTAERESGLATLAGERFDLAIDFIAYRGDEPAQVIERIAPGRYLLISSTWLPRLWGGTSAIEEFAGDADQCDNDLPPLTRRYLAGKLGAERAVAACRRAGGDAVSLRLPIMLGDGDHTRRLEFYRSRIADGAALIAVAGGANLAQIVWVEDLAAAIAAWVGSDLMVRHPVWEALPGPALPVRDILAAIAAALDRPLAPVEVGATELAAELPAYLDAEPLWRESALPVSAANLFSVLDRQPTPLAGWLRSLPPPPAADAELRAAELRFLARRHAS